MTILITGARGLLGSELGLWLQNSSQNLRADIVSWDLPDFDITDTDRVKSEIKRLRPSIIIHLAALTDVDGCELNRAKTYRINTVATGGIVEAARESDSVLAFLSTDYVFDGTKGSPYDETDHPHPLSYYGQTKLAAEKEVQKQLRKFFTIRTAGLYGRPGKNFVDTILSQAQTQKTLSVVDDQTTSPTSARDLCPHIERLLTSSRYGIYHLANSGYCSWFEFAGAIIKFAGLKNQVLPITTSESGRTAPRPAFSALDCRKFERAFNERLRPWKDALADYLKSAG
jgi:dTDP-4-dehydrorhamnose reductase